MINEAIILAGGMGTRLKSMVSDIPKPMAEVAGKPFLEYLLNKLSDSGIVRVILAVGYKYEVIKEYFGEFYNGMELVYSIEDEPLGTGGAIAQALSLATKKHLFLLNGDSYHDVDLKALSQFHEHNGFQLTFALKPMTNFDRYGVVVVEGDKVTAFKEKGYYSNGLINGGVYALSANLLKSIADKRFSFETDFIDKEFKNIGFGGCISDTYFIDIGIPEDYIKANQDFEQSLG